MKGRLLALVVNVVWFFPLLQISAKMAHGLTSVEAVPPMIDSLIDGEVFYHTKKVAHSANDSMLKQPRIINKDGVSLVEGDIMIEGLPEDEKAPTELLFHLRKVGGNLWPDNTVPWRIDSSLPAYSKRSMERIKTAMQWWEKHTCIKFVPASTRPHRTALVISNIEQCSSFVGYQNTKQDQVLKLLQPRCIPSPGTPAHEFGHALGLIHEHSRVDRDDYIAINPRHLSSHVMGNYQKSYDTSIPEGVGYDVGSIMHYGGRTFRSKLPSKQSLMGQREALGFYDIKAINIHYKCKARCNNRCENDGYPHLSNGKCICVCPEGLSGRSCEKVESNCGSVIGLKAGGRAKISSPGYPKPVTSSQSRCWWLITAPPGHFIELKFEDMDVAQSPQSIRTGASCIHHLEIRSNLFGQGGDLYCGKGKVGPFNTELGQMKNKMVVGLDMRSRKTARGRGFSATVTTYQDACASNPCKNGATCQSKRSAHFTCTCRNGFYGKHCEIVNDAGISCDFSDGMCDLVNSRSDQLDFQRGFYFSKYAGERLERSANGDRYLLAAPVEYSMTPGSEAKLYTGSTFSASGRSNRCLTFYSKFVGYPWQNAELSVHLVHPKTLAPMRKLTTLTKKNGGKWRQNRIQLSHKADYKIQFTLKTGKSSKFNSFVGLDDINVTPHHCSGGPCAASPCVGKGSVCVESSPDTYKCLCPPERTGSKCQSFIASDGDGDVCNFNSADMCGYTQVTNDDFDWRRTQGASDSRLRTGPRSAADGSGYYIVADSSSGKAKKGSMARIVSPELQQIGPICVGFYYHMYGTKEVGSLKLKMKYDRRVQRQVYFQKTGSQSKNWIYTEANVNVRTHKAKLVFEATAGTKDLSDIAVDDVKITKGKCSRK